MLRCAPCTLQRVLRPRSTNISPLCSLHPLADDIHPMSPHTSPTLFRRTVTLANYTLLHCTAVHPLRTVAVPFRATANPPCAMVAPLPSEPSPSFAAKLPAIAAMYAVKLLLVCAMVAPCHQQRCTLLNSSSSAPQPQTCPASASPPRRLRAPRVHRDVKLLLVCATTTDMSGVCATTTDTPRVCVSPRRLRAPRVHPTRKYCSHQFPPSVCVCV